VPVVDRHRASQELRDIGHELVSRGGHGLGVLPHKEVQVIGEAGAPVGPLFGIEEAEVAGLYFLDRFYLFEGGACHELLLSGGRYPVYSSLSV
jgi:hypothetical protein